MLAACLATRSANFSSGAYVALCPNCSSKVSWDATTCPECQADFAYSSAWRPIGESDDERACIIEKFVAQADSSETVDARRTGFLMSGFLFCFSASVLVGYPVGQCFGSSPGYWLVAAITLTGMSFGYTILPKQELVQKVNFLILLFFYFFVVGVSAAVSPKVGEDWFAIFMLSAFTLGAPLVLPVAFLVWHARACLRYGEKSGV